MERSAKGYAEAAQAAAQEAAQQALLTLGLYRDADGDLCDIDEEE